jgi:hypothetical protein
MSVGQRRNAKRSVKEEKNEELGREWTYMGRRTAWQVE